jgi:hypothetical protein
MNSSKYGFCATVLLTDVKFGMRMKSMIPKMRAWAIISQLFSSQSPSFVFMALNGWKYALSAGFLNLFFYFRKTLKNYFAYRDNSSILRFLLRICFAPEKNSSPGASSRTFMIALVTL